MRGPLAGLPIAVKDNMVTEGVTTTCGSKILHNYQPVYTATAVRQLWEDHVVMLGKTNLDEFAMGSSHRELGLPGHAQPVGPEHVPGGSSGGSAAAVAAGEALWALGSDTGGSIRQPAVALRHRRHEAHLRRRQSRYGLIAFASSLDQIGPLTRSVYDCALLLQHLVGHDPRDSTSVELPEPVALPSAERLDGLRIGVPARVPGRRHRAGRARALRRDAGAHRGARRHLRRDQPAAHRVRPAGLLHHRAGRGLGEPGPLRRRALRLPLRRARRPARPVRAHARRGLRRRGQAAHHDRHLRAVRRLLRRLLRPRPEGPHAGAPRLRRGVRRRRPDRLPDVAHRGLQGRVAHRRPAGHVPERHLHDPGQPRRPAGDQHPLRPQRRPAGGLPAHRPGVQREPHARGRARARGRHRVRHGAHVPRRRVASGPRGWRTDWPRSPARSLLSRRTRSHE